MKCQGFESRLHGNVRAQRAGRASYGSTRLGGGEGAFYIRGQSTGSKAAPGWGPAELWRLCPAPGGQHLPAQPLALWPIPEGRAISHGGKSVTGRAAASIRCTPSVRSGPVARGGGSPAVPCTPVCRSCSIEWVQGVRQCGRTQVPPKGLSEEDIGMDPAQERRPRGRAELGESRVGGMPGLPRRPPQLCPRPLVHAPSDVRLGPPAVLPASAAPTVRAPLPAAGPTRP